MQLSGYGLRRIPLPRTSVNKAASVSVYKGRHLFRGSEKEERGVGTIAEPRTQKEVHLLDSYTTALRSQNSQVAKFTYGLNFGEFPFYDVG
jgi:hypothetical protein